MHKKQKNANKRISYFFPLRCFLSAFLIFVCLFAFCAFAWLRVCVFSCFLLFLCFLCVQNLFVKKNEKFKTTLITSFILLLTYYVSKMGNNFHPTISPQEKNIFLALPKTPQWGHAAPPDHLTSGKYNLIFLSKNKTNRIIAAHRSYYRSFHLLSLLFFTVMDLSSTRKAISKLWEDTRCQNFTGVVFPPSD